MREYEAMVILDPNLEDEKIEATLTKIEGLIKKDKNSIEKVDKWGKRKLAYPINKETSGYYVVYYFKGDEGHIKEIDRVLKISDEVLRHTVFRRGD